MANQTTRATEEIARQVGEVHELAAAINGAVGEQQTATPAIADTVAQVSAGTRTVSDTMWPTC